MAGGPASDAGNILVGDVIVGINGQYVLGMEPEYILEAFSAPGQIVVLNLAPSSQVHLVMEFWGSHKKHVRDQLRYTGSLKRHDYTGTINTADRKDIAAIASAVANQLTATSPEGTAPIRPTTTENQTQTSTVPSLVSEYESDLERAGDDLEVFAYDNKEDHDLYEFIALETTINNHANYDAGGALRISTDGSKSERTPDGVTPEYAPLALSPQQLDTGSSSRADLTTRRSKEPQEAYLNIESAVNKMRQNLFLLDDRITHELDTMTPCRSQVRGGRGPDTLQFQTQAVARAQRLSPNLEESPTTPRNSPPQNDTNAIHSTGSLRQVWQHQDPSAPGLGSKAPIKHDGHRDAKTDVRGAGTNAAAGNSTDGEMPRYGALGQYTKR